MTTAIVGVGNIGSALARHLVAGGEPVVLAAKDEARAQALADELGPLAGRLVTSSTTRPEGSSTATGSPFPAIANRMYRRPLVWRTASCASAVTLRALAGTPSSSKAARTLGHRPAGVRWPPFR